MKTANVNANNLAAFTRLEQSANEQQKQISNKLHSQGLILLTGAAEALLKDAFEDLLTKNFVKVRSAKGINFTTIEIQEALLKASDAQIPIESISTQLGKHITKKLFNGKNPTEKINFQNIQTMRLVFEQYFGITFGTDMSLDSIHRYWQVRHCLIHNNAVIDERFIHNVNQVKLLKSKEALGKKVTVSKADYTKAREDFVNLFAYLSAQITQADLQCKYTQPVS